MLGHHSTKYGCVCVCVYVSVSVSVQLLIKMLRLDFIHVLTLYSERYVLVICM